MLPHVLNKYNNTKHSTTGLAPNEAVKPSNHMDVWLNISNKAIYNRRYPPLKSFKPSKGISEAQFFKKKV